MVLSNGKGTLDILEARWLERLSDFSAFEMGVRVSCIAMKKDNPVLPGMKKPHAVKDRRDATLIQSVSIEPPIKRQYTCNYNHDPVLPQVVKWLETSVKTPTADVEEGGRKLLSY